MIRHSCIFGRSNRIFALIWCGSYSRWTIHCHWLFWNGAGYVFSSHIARPIPTPPRWPCSPLLHPRSFQNWSYVQRAGVSDREGKARFCMISPIGFFTNNCWQAFVNAKCTWDCSTLYFCSHNASWWVCCCGRSSFKQIKQLIISRMLKKRHINSFSSKNDKKYKD